MIKITIKGHNITILTLREVHLYNNKINNNNNKSDFIL